MTSRQEPTTVTRTGAHLFFEAARRYGITHVFSNPGTTEIHFVDTLAEFPDIGFYLCLDEDSTTGAAAGFSRFTGWPAMANVHLGPGLAHGLANLHNAKRAGVPVIATIGDHHTRYGLEDPALASDILMMARSVCKWSYAARVPEELPAVLHRAMLQALTPPIGPVCLILPDNVMAAAVTEDIAIPELHIPRLGVAPADAIREAAAMLRSAHKPLIVIGKILSPDGLNALVDIARRTGAQLYREYSPTWINPASDPTTEYTGNKLPYRAIERRQILQQADCVLLVGATNFTGFFLQDDDPVVELIAPNVPAIHISPDVSELGKNAKNALPLLGDVDLTARALAQKLADDGVALGPMPPTKDYNDSFTPDDSKPLTPEVLGRALRAYAPPDLIYVDEAITSGFTIWNAFVEGNRKISGVMTGRGGSLGYGIPASIGAQLANMDKPTLAIIGDGTALYSIQALWTLAHYGLPVVTIICKNRNYDIITFEIMHLKGALAQQGIERVHDYTAMTKPEIDFVALARGFGIEAQQVAKPSELQGAIEAAFKAGKPVLLEVLLKGSGLSPSE